MGVLTVRATGLYEQVEGISQLFRDAAGRSEKFVIVEESKDYPDEDSNYKTRYWTLDV